MYLLFKLFSFIVTLLNLNKNKVAKNKGARIRITLEHKCEQGVYRYHTTKNRRNTTERLELKKYSPVTKKHEVFREIK
jgi:large subunit ribosomal protein L33